MRGMRRSIELFKGFRREQDDPIGFYRLLADDAVREMSRYCQLTGARVIDIGGASGYVGEAIADAGAAALTVEYDWAQIVEHGRRLRHGVQGDGLALPVFDAAFDVAYSSNVLEHVPDPEQMLREMVRVVCPGGIVFVTYTNWLSPWAATRQLRGTTSAASGRLAVTRGTTGRSRRIATGSACTGCR